ncbi:hypothetical protein [Modestobacter lacusdianchii]
MWIRARARLWSWQKALAVAGAAVAVLWGGWPQFVVVSGVLLLLAVKAYAILRAIGWAAANAKEYSAAYQADVPQTVEEGIALLRGRGRFFLPFGIKDHVLRGWTHERDTDTRQQARTREVARRTASCLFGARPLVKAAAAVCLLADLALARRAEALHVPGTDVPLVVVLAVTTAVVSTVLVVEAVTWYVTAGSYARPFHMLGFTGRTAAAQPPASAEIRVFARLTAYAVLADIVACTAVQRFTGGFSAAREGAGLAAEFDRLTHFAYFALSSLTTTGGSPVEPESSVANLLSALVMTQTLLIVVFALTLASSLLREDADQPR